MTAKQLDTPLKTISGAQIMLTATKPLTYRSALVSACETFQTDTPGSGEMLKAYDLGMKIMDVKDKLEVSKEDVDFLKKIVEHNRAFMAVVVGRLLEFINKSN
jgi:hypothetical protein